MFFSFLSLTEAAYSSISIRDLKEVLLDVPFIVVGADPEPIMNPVDITVAPIRPGDNNVKLRVEIINTGELLAKDVEAQLICNADFKPSRSGTNQSYSGKLNDEESKKAIFFFDLSDYAEQKICSLAIQICSRDYKVVCTIDILVESPLNPEIKLKLESFSDVSEAVQQLPNNQQIIFPA